MDKWLIGALILWAAALSLIDFILMGVDKRRARRDQWRVRERTLLILAALGGSPGAILGMWAFHHKTRHNQFQFGLPAMLLAQLGLLIWWMLTR